MLASLESFVGNTLEIKIPKPGNKSIGYLFGFMEILLSQHPIKDYSAQQTTLEQIFNSFAKENDLSKFNKSFRARKASVRK